MRRGDAVRPCQEYLKAQRKGFCYLLLTYQRVEFAGRIHNKPPEEWEFVVDSGASMHMLSRKDLNSAELETVKVSISPTSVYLPTRERC